MTNPMEDAWNATIEPRSVYGQVTVDTYHCVLIKGQGKVLYDPDTHSQDQKRTSIELTLTAIPEMNYNRPVVRNMIAESNEWVKIVLASLKALKLRSLSDLNGAWVKAQLVPSGRKWTNSSGEERDHLEIYTDEDQCRAGYYEDRGTSSDDDLFGPDPAAEETPKSNGSADKATVYEFLRVLVNQYCNDEQALAAAIAAMPMISKHFTVDSPETQELLKKVRNAA